MTKKRIRWMDIALAIGALFLGVKSAVLFADGAVRELAALGLLAGFGGCVVLIRSAIRKDDKNS